MGRKRCKDCASFCTDDCEYREDVDTMTFACLRFKKLPDDATPLKPIVDLEADKWEK